MANPGALKARAAVISGFEIEALTLLFEALCISEEQHPTTPASENAHGPSTTPLLELPPELQNTVLLYVSVWAIREKMRMYAYSATDQTPRRPGRSRAYLPAAPATGPSHALPYHGAQGQPQYRAETARTVDE